MSLIAIEGFEPYVTQADLFANDLWGGNMGGFTFVTGRDGVGKALNSTNDGYYFSTSFGGDRTTVIVGWAFYLVGGSPTNEEMVVFRDNGTAQCSLQLRSDGNVAFYNGFSTGSYIIETSTSTPVSSGQWNYFELEVTFHTTAGAYELRINGETEMSGTNVDTTETAGNHATSVEFRGMDIDCRYDDIYVLDTLGSTNNDFLGDVIVETIYPSAEGTTIEWTPSTGTDNSALVDDPQNDTDYVSSSTLDDEDLYAIDDLSSSVDTVYGLQVTVRGNKEVVGNRGVAALTKSGANNQTGQAKGLSTSIAYYTHMFETYDGSNAWTKTLVNAAEIGIKVTG